MPNNDVIIEFIDASFWEIHNACSFNAIKKNNCWEITSMFGLSLGPAPWCIPQLPTEYIQIMRAFRPPLTAAVAAMHTNHVFARTIMESNGEMEECIFTTEASIGFDLSRW